MKDNQGVPASPSGSRASHDASKLSSPKASIPNAGDWCVIANTSGFRGMMIFDLAQVERVTDKMIYAKAHYKRQHSIDNVLWMPNKTEAELFVARAKSAYAEATQRERAAWGTYKGTIAKLIGQAQGIEAGTATTEGRGPKDESPVTK